MNNLRSKLIRLAHQKPQLRKHLLPILKEAKGSISVVVWGERTDYTGKYGKAAPRPQFSQKAYTILEVMYETDGDSDWIADVEYELEEREIDYSEKEFEEALDMWNYNQSDNDSVTVDLLDHKKKYSSIQEALKDIEKKINKAFNKLKASESMADLEWKYVRGDFKYKHTHEEEQLDWRGHTVGEYVAYEDELTIRITDEKGKELDQDTIKRILKALNSYRSPIWKQFK